MKNYNQRVKNPLFKKILIKMKNYNQRVKKPFI